MGTRFYDIHGRRYPSVTTILSVISKPALIGWAANVERTMIEKASFDLYKSCQLLAKPLGSSAWQLALDNLAGKEKVHYRKLRKASEIGSSVHAMIEWSIRASMCLKCGPQPEIGPEAQWSFSRWQQWRDSKKFRPVAIETTVHDEENGYAGTLDLLALLVPAGCTDEVLAVIDWKTGKSIYAEAKLQNAAYRRARSYSSLGTPEIGVIIRLPKIEKDPEFEALEIGDCDADFDTFMHAKSVWEWQNANTTPWGVSEIKGVKGQMPDDLTGLLRKSVETV